MKKQVLAGLLGCCMALTVAIPCIAVTDKLPSAMTDKVPSAIVDTTYRGADIGSAGAGLATDALWCEGSSGFCGMNAQGQCTGTVTFRCYRFNDPATTVKYQKVKCKYDKHIGKCYAKNPVSR